MDHQLTLQYDTYENDSTMRKQIWNRNLHLINFAFGLNVYDSLEVGQPTIELVWVCESGCQP
jgi:hypothetical protein